MALPTPPTRSPVAGLRTSMVVDASAARFIGSFEGDQGGTAATGLRGGVVERDDTRVARE